MWNRLKKKVEIEYLIIGYIWISQLYYSYRYLLKINSTGTSPTYSDTPLFLKIFKYILLAVFMILILININYKDFIDKNSRFIGLKKKSPFIIMILFIIFIMIKIIVVKDISILIKILPFLFFSLLVIFVRDKEKFVELLINNLKYMLYFHIFYSGIQILAYIFIGRLPALAYAEGLVRFGGGYDDPNGFGMFLILPTIYLCFKNFIYKNINVKEIILLGIILFLEIITWSFTCLGLLVVIYGGTLAYYLLFKVKSKKIKTIILIIIPIIIMFITFIFKDLLLEVLLAKLGSINAHLNEISIIEQFREYKVIEILFGSFNKYFALENYMKQFLLNYGLVGVSFLLYIIILLVKYLKTSMLVKDYKYIVGIVYVFTYLIGNLNLPFMMVYPVNILFFVIITLIFFKYKEK